MQPHTHSTPQTTATIAIALLTMFTIACDRRHADDVAVEEALEAIALPSGEAAKTTPAPRLVVSEGQIYLDLSLLLAALDDEKSASVKGILESNEVDAARRAWKVGPLASDPEELVKSASAFTTILDALAREQVITAAQRNTIALHMDRSTPPDALITAYTMAARAGFGNIEAVTVGGAIAFTTPKICGAKPASAPPAESVKCEFCELISNRPAGEDQECLLPVVVLGDGGTYVWTEVAESGREACHAGHAASDDLAIGQGAEGGRATSPRYALILEDEKTCPSAKDGEGALSALLDRMDRELPSPLCGMAWLAPGSKSWGETIAIAQQLSARRGVTAISLASREATPADCKVGYVMGEP